MQGAVRVVDEGTVDGDPDAYNPNASWVNFKGTWTTNTLLVAGLRLFFAVIPGITPEAAWTLTNVSYCTVTHT